MAMASIAHASRPTRMFFMMIYLRFLLLAPHQRSTIPMAASVPKNEARKMMKNFTM